MFSSQKHSYRRLLLASIMLLAGCAVYVEPSTQVQVRTQGSYRITLGNVISVFEPDRGAGATYGVGEEIRFRILSARSGYVTLTAIDPDGFVYVLGPRNVYVEGGTMTTLPSARYNIRFTAAPPRGFHRVRASVTPSPTDTTITVYQGRRGSEVWTEAIVTEIERYPREARDIFETNLFIR
jgi:hypothetical protein